MTDARSTDRDPDATDPHGWIFDPDGPRPDPTGVAPGEEAARTTDGRVAAEPPAIPPPVPPTVPASVPLRLPDGGKAGAHRAPRGAARLRGMVGVATGAIVAVAG